MCSFLTGIKDVTPATLLISPPSMQWGDWVQNEELIKESKNLGDLYRKLADGLKIMFADADAWQVDLSYDGVHFSEKGHASFAAALDRTLQTFKSSAFDECSK